MTRSRFVVMMRTGSSWTQIGATHLTLDSARAALNEYRRGPDADGTFRIFQEVE